MRGVRDASVAFIVMVVSGLVVAGAGVYEVDATSIVLGIILCSIGAFALSRFSLSRGEKGEIE